MATPKRPSQVDSKVPRGKAALHALIPGVGFLLGDRPAAGLVIGLTGLAMAASVVGGPRFSVIGHLFRGVLRPVFKIKPGAPEALAPHRFAEAIGAFFLIASAALFFAGAIGAAQVLALIVVSLATLNFASGICVGCQLFLLITRSRRAVTA